MENNDRTFKCLICGFVGNAEEFKEKHKECVAQNKPKLLFVDDRTKRIEFALSAFPDYDVTIATCVPEALRQLCRQEWDFVSLDHDLNGHDFQDPDTPTCGMEIVRYIIKTGWPGELEKPIFWIHSSNLFAAHLMITTLMRNGHKAYSFKVDYNEKNIKYDEKGIPA